MNTHLNFTGASHIPIIEYNNKLCIVLFAEPKYEIYMDSGGHAEKNESPIDTASREGREESLNTFNIDRDLLSNYINYYNISNMINYRNYYAFFIKYNISWDDINKIYSNNKSIIFNSSNVPNFWKESNNVTIFSIDSLLNGYTSDNNYFRCVDMFGNNKIVHRRPIKYLCYAINQKILKQQDCVWKICDIPTKNIVVEKNITNDYLNNTMSIRILN